MSVRYGVLLAIASIGGWVLPLTAQDPLAGLDAYVREAVRVWEVPGLAIAVVKDGEVVFERGYGVLALDRAAAVDPETLFAIGSTTKAMTAAAIGMLVDEGELGWDDPVIDHLEWFQLRDPHVTREVSVRDLLTHRAGLPNADYLWYEQENTTEEIVRRLRYVEPETSLRSNFTYQNIMYAAAGELIASVSGVSWNDFIRTRILEPLGMSGSVTTLAETVSRPNVARPHDRVEGRLVEIENASVDPVAAAGSVWSSVRDMAKWLRFLLDGGVTADGRRLLSEATVAELFTPQVILDPDDFYPTARLTHPSWITYGLGWFQADYEGRKVDFHTGSIDGMVAIAGLLRGEGVGVYVLGNRDHAELRHALMYRVFDLNDPEPARDWSAELKALYDGIAAEAERRADERESERVDGTSPSLALEAYAGQYSDPLYGTVQIRRRGDDLFAEYGRLRGPLRHWHFDTFRVDWETAWRGGALVSFELDSGGRAAALTFPRGRFERVYPD